jgi:hypothetical protein
MPALGLLLILCAYPVHAGTNSFDQQVVASIVPGQPFDSFFGECPGIAHRGGTTWFVYTSGTYDIYARTFDHGLQSLTPEIYIADGWNDHINPALLLDDDGYLHLLYAARPLPMRYHRSLDPLDHTGWNSYEEVGTSATYPVPYILGDSLFVIYREGDSYGASLSMAMRDLAQPPGTPGAWTVTTLVSESGVFVPMPLAAWERDGEVCFLFNMRDALLSSPHTSTSPSVREGMSVICTADGSTFTDLSGDILSLPLEYREDRDGFPEVTGHEEYVDLPLESAGVYAAGGMRHDGSFVEMTVTPHSYDLTRIVIGDSTKCSSLVEFIPSGVIVASHGIAGVPLGQWTPGTTYTLRLKYSFSTGTYRPWLNGRLATNPLDLDCAGWTPDEELSIDSIYVDILGDCTARLRTGREYKLITASAAADSGGVANFFFIDRMDSSERSRWRLMYQREGEVTEIGDTLYHKYHPSVVRIADMLCVAVAYFEADGLFLDNDHLCDNSRIMLLASNDREYWDETELASGGGGHVHPIFKRSDGSGITELVWARIESGTSTSLMHSFDGAVTGLRDRVWDGPVAAAYPNPSSGSTAIRFSIAAGCEVTIGIYDCSGRLVARMAESRFMERGSHEMIWDGYDRSGRKSATGIYFIRIEYGGLVMTRKIVLLR